MMLKDILKINWGFLIGILSLGVAAILPQENWQFKLAAFIIGMVLMHIDRIVSSDRTFYKKIGSQIKTKISPDLIKFLQKSYGLPFVTSEFQNDIAYLLEKGLIEMIFFPGGGYFYKFTELTWMMLNEYKGLRIKLLPEIMADIVELDYWQGHKRTDNEIRKNINKEEEFFNKKYAISFEDAYFELSDFIKTQNVKREQGELLSPILGRYLYEKGFDIAKQEIINPWLTEIKKKGAKVK